MGSLKDSLNQISNAAAKMPVWHCCPWVYPASSFCTEKSGPSLKFSNDTERLQQINNIRKSSAGLQMKRVINFIFKTRKVLTAEEINAETYVNMKANKDVFDNLNNNPKVFYDDTRFSYKAMRGVKGKRELLHLIRSHTKGIAVIDLKDAYPIVEEDFQVLKAAGDIWLLCEDSKEEIAYPNDPRVPIKVDDDLKKFFGASNCLDIS